MIQNDQPTLFKIRNVQQHYFDVFLSIPASFVMALGEQTIMMNYPITRRKKSVNTDGTIGPGKLDWSDFLRK